MQTQPINPPIGLRPRQLHLVRRVTPKRTDIAPGGQRDALANGFVPDFLEMTPALKVSRNKGDCHDNQTT